MKKSLFILSCLLILSNSSCKMFRSNSDDLLRGIKNSYITVRVATDNFKSFVDEEDKSCSSHPSNKDSISKTNKGYKLTGTNQEYPFQRAKEVTQRAERWKRISVNTKNATLQTSPNSNMSGTCEYCHGTGNSALGSCNYCSGTGKKNYTITLK